MTTDRDTLEALFRSTNPDDLHQALQTVRQEISGTGTQEARPLFDLVASLFYIDPLDRPDLAPVAAEALGRIGAGAIDPLVDNHDTTEDPL